MSFTDIPVRPSNFTYIKDEFQPGFYILGVNKFTVSNAFNFSPLIHRELTSADEFILGALSVIIIAILSEISQTILMRTANRNISVIGFTTAFLVSEISHFRNVWHHFRTTRFRSTSPPAVTTPNSETRQIPIISRRRAYMSIMVISISTGLFAADVVTVLLTQPRIFTSNTFQYNLKAKHPVATKIDLAKFVRRVTMDRPCVSPVFADSTLKRNFQINSCILLEENKVLNEDNDISDTIKISSWFHRGGSDHNVTVGEAFISISLRANLLPTEGQGLARRILFENVDDDDRTHTQYLHELVIYGAIDWACKQNFSAKTCTELNEELQMSSSKEIRRIVLWRGRKDYRTSDVVGLTTTCNIGINAPFRALSAGLRYLITTAVIEETTGKGAYSRVRDDVEEDGIKGLLSEEGRVAGVFLFLCLLMVLCIVLIGLRWWFKPISLGHVAMLAARQQITRNREADDTIFANEVDFDAAEEPVIFN